MIKKVLLFFLCLTLFLSIPYCKKKLPTQPDIPDEPEIVLPIIEYFTATPESITLGESSILSWETKNATTITIDQDVGTVSAKDTKEVSPEETTTYTLTATNSDGQKIKSCTVTVERGAYFELTSYSYGYSSPDYPPPGTCVITGIVTNVGNATGYNVEIALQAYNADNVIIGTALGQPAGLGNIPPGVGATFSGYFDGLTDWDVIKKVEYEITWLTAMDVRLNQAGVIRFK